MEMRQSAAIGAVLLVGTASVVGVEPEAPLEIDMYNEMQQYVSGYPGAFVYQADTDPAVALFDELNASFTLGKRTFSRWLDVKERSLYDWIKNPDSSRKYRTQIEFRLTALKTLKDDMEPEHRDLIEKIAFSPIYGDTRFGEAILVGAASDELLQWYDKLYTKFEARRRMLKREQRIA